jgi:hypothetical protein
MKIVIAKAAKRTRDEGKETVFFHGDSQITAKRIKNFMNRKTTDAAEMISPSASE